MVPNLTQTAFYHWAKGVRHSASALRFHKLTPAHKFLPSSIKDREIVQFAILQAPIQVQTYVLLLEGVAANATANRSQSAVGFVHQ